jgi:molybdopterin molybdotransferase
MSPFWQVITRQEAERLFAQLAFVETEEIPLRKGLGRILGEDVVSEVNVPHFRRSNMDGYALRAEDTYGATESSPVQLKMIGHVEMGLEANLTLSAGEAAQIATGGMLPQGADAMVMVEYTELFNESTVNVKRAVAPGEHIVSIGEDIKIGDIVLTRGRRLRPQDIGALAAIGATRIPVYRRPRVAILSTGDEIVPSDVQPGPGQIRGTNLYTLAALTEQFGGTPVDFGIIKDDYDQLRDSITEAVASCDVVAVSGGSSVGSQDITINVIQSLQADSILAHGVAIRPGKPTILAMTKGKPVIGLPGHPVSAAIVFQLLVKPIIYRMMNYTEGFTEKATLRAKLSQNLPSPSGREDYVRVSLRREGDQWWAHPVLGKSGTISTLTKADGLVKIDLELEGLEQGQWVEVRPL